MKNTLLILPIASLTLTACANANISTNSTPIPTPTLPTFPIESVIEKITVNLQIDLIGTLDTDPVKPYHIEITRTPAGKKLWNGKQVNYTSYEVLNNGEIKRSEMYYTSNPFRYLGNRYISGYSDSQIASTTISHTDIPKVAKVNSQGDLYQTIDYTTADKSKIKATNTFTWQLKPYENSSKTTDISKLAKLCINEVNSYSEDGNTGYFNRCYVINQQGKILSAEMIGKWYVQGRYYTLNLKSK